MPNSALSGRIRHFNHVYKLSGIAPASKNRPQVRPVKHDSAGSASGDFAGNAETFNESFVQYGNLKYLHSNNESEFKARLMEDEA